VNPLSEPADSPSSGQIGCHTGQIAAIATPDEQVAAIESHGYDTALENGANSLATQSRFE
jgi:hypothetical protein